METKTYRMVILSDQTFLYSRGLFVHFQIWNNLDFDKIQDFVKSAFLSTRNFEEIRRVSYAAYHTRS